MEKFNITLPLPQQPSSTATQMFLSTQTPFQRSLPLTPNPKHFTEFNFPLHMFDAQKSNQMTKVREKSEENSDQDEDKVGRRREMNRLAQQKSRQRKDEQRLTLAKENESLKEQLLRVKAECDVWKKMATNAQNLKEDDMKVVMKPEPVNDVKRVSQEEIEKMRMGFKMEVDGLVEKLTAVQNELQRMYDVTRKQSEIASTLNQALCHQELRYRKDLETREEKNKEQKVPLELTSVVRCHVEPISVPEPVVSRKRKLVKVSRNSVMRNNKKLKMMMKMMQKDKSIERNRI